MNLSSLVKKLKAITPEERQSAKEYLEAEDLRLKELYERQAFADEARLEDYD